MAVLAALATPVLAQQGNIQSLYIHTIKQDRVADYLAAEKEIVAIAKKSGLNHYFTQWASLTGPPEFVVVQNFSKWGDQDLGTPDGLKEYQADLQRIMARISPSEEGIHRIIEEVLPEYSLPSNGETPKMIRTLLTKVRPDKVNEYLALWKSEVLPAAKKSGLTYFSLAQVRYGAPSTEFVSVAGLNSWADLDGGFGVEKAMGKEGYQSFLTRIRPFIVESEYNLYRFLPDLSYLPAPAGK